MKRTAVHRYPGDTDPETFIGDEYGLILRDASETLLVTVPNTVDNPYGLGDKQMAGSYQIRAIFAAGSWSQVVVSDEVPQAESGESSAPDIPASLEDVINEIPVG